MRTLLAIPVYNEQKYVSSVLERVRHHISDVLVVDDGSTDDTPCLLARAKVDVIRHAENRGYGRAMQDAFRWACVDRYDWVITMDCDEQHEPEAIPEFVRMIETDRYDVISGSRYLSRSALDDCPPADRRAINATMTREINTRLGLAITDAFCGFKAYRVSAVAALGLSEDGYAFPMQFWARARRAGLRITEIPVRLIYADLNRSFGGPLDQAERRLAYYREVLERELQADAAVEPVAAREACCPG